MSPVAARVGKSKKMADWEKENRARASVDLHW